MKKLLLISVILGIILLIVVIYAYNFTKKKSAPIESNYENYYDYFIQKVRYEQNQSNLRIDSLQGNLQIDLKKYIQTFDNLSIEKGWLLDYYYFYNADAGRPIFYIRESTCNKDSLLKTFDNYGIFKYSDSIEVIDHLKTNNKKTGLYQLLIFNLIGEDFAKFWHSNYGNLEIICSRRTVNELANRKDEFHNFDSETKKRLLEVDYLPAVKEYKDSITYRILIFNSWDGLFENIYSINKHFPHKIKMIKDSALVKYNCGIMF